MTRTPIPTAHSGSAFRSALADLDRHLGRVPKDYGFEAWLVAGSRSVSACAAALRQFVREIHRPTYTEVVARRPELDHRLRSFRARDEQLLADVVALESAFEHACNRLDRAMGARPLPDLPLLARRATSLVIRCRAHEEAVRDWHQDVIYADRGGEG